MKPDIENMAEETATAYHEWLHGTRLKHSTPELARFIAKALLTARNQGRYEGLRGAEDSLAGPAAWLDNWAKHVGSCQGGVRCTCGLTLARAEISAALRKSQGEKE